MNHLTKSLIFVFHLNEKESVYVLSIVLLHNPNSYHCSS